MRLNNKVMGVFVGLLLYAGVQTVGNIVQKHTPQLKESKTIEQILGVDSAYARETNNINTRELLKRDGFVIYETFDDYFKAIEDSVNKKDPKATFSGGNRYAWINVYSKYYEIRNKLIPNVISSKTLDELTNNVVTDNDLEIYMGGPCYLDNYDVAYLFLFVGQPSKAGTVIEKRTKNSEGMGSYFVAVKKIPKPFAKELVKDFRSVFKRYVKKEKKQNN